MPATLPFYLRLLFHWHAIVTAIIGADARLHVPALKRAQAADGSWGEWSRPGCAPVPLTGDPSIGIAANGSFEVFVTASDNTLWNLQQASPVGEFGSGWRSIASGVQGRPSPVSDANGNLDVFVPTTENELGLVQSSPPQSPVWQSLVFPGGVLTGNPVEGLDPNGTVQVLATGTDQALWNISITEGGSKSVGQPRWNLER